MATMMGPILLATRNPGKAGEMKRLFSASGFKFVSLADFPEIGEIEETGTTFAENAILKAAGYAALAGTAAIADDSGLEVDALDGAPGVLSARYGGPGASDADRIRKLLKDLDAVDGQGRSARFVCSVALADTDGRILALEEGVCPGRIASVPSGSGGFGYDPVFIPEGYDRTFAELSGEIKNRTSHRAQAGMKIMRYLLGFTGG
ncbi:MAG: RdgB/HAM1 family non-canonical purine NTP pyrophosphatase [Pyrinomonadaceae bacterium]